MPFVVPPRSPVVNAAVYKALAKDRYLGVVAHSRRIEALLQFLNGLVSFCKAGHSLPIARVHQLGQDKYPVLVFSASIKSLIEYSSKMLEVFRFESSEGIDIFISEFKRQVLLQLDSFAREITHEEPIVNMEDASILFYHYIAIMPILNL